MSDQINLRRYALRFTHQHLRSRMEYNKSTFKSREFEKSTRKCFSTFFLKKMFLYKVNENANFEKVWSIFLRIKSKRFKLFLAFLLHQQSSFFRGKSWIFSYIPLLATPTFCVPLHKNENVCVKRVSDMDE